VDDLRESPSLSIIEILRRAGSEVSYNGPYFPTVGHRRKYDLNMTSEPLENVADYDCVLIVTDHSSSDYARIVLEAELIIDSRNGQPSEKIVRC
jgi:UDP-N-acetyl-D-glucosamine dehydrogenase